MKETPNPSSISLLLQWGGNGEGLSGLGVQSRKEKGTSVGRVTSLFPGFTGANRGQVGTPFLLGGLGPCSHGTHQAGDLPGPKLAVNQCSPAGGTSDPRLLASSCYGFLLLDLLLVPTDLGISPRVTFSLSSSSASPPIWYCDSFPLHHPWDLPSLTPRMVLFKLPTCLSENRDQRRGKGQLCSQC